MIIIYNLVGVGLGAAALVLSLAIFLILGLGHAGWFVLIAGLIAVGLDVWYRMRHESRWFAPSAGGSFFFLPLWLLSSLITVFGMLMLIVPERPRRDNLADQASTAVGPPATTLANGLAMPATDPSVPNPRATDSPASEMVTSPGKRTDAEPPAAASPVPTVNEPANTIQSPPTLPGQQPSESSPATAPAEPTSATSSESAFDRGQSLASSPLPKLNSAESRGPRPGFGGESPFRPRNRPDSADPVQPGPAHSRNAELADRSSRGATPTVSPFRPVAPSAGVSPFRSTGRRPGDRSVTSPESASDGSGEITTETKLSVGQKVETKWGNSWFASEVLELLADGNVRVHYTGWSSGSDETVDRTRLRKPSGLVGPRGGR